MTERSPARREWRALSVRQPFATLIVAGVKPYEGRSWRPAMLGPVLIHASSALDSAVHESVILRALDRLGADPDDLPMSQIIGMVNVVDIITGPDAMRVVPKKHRLLVDPIDGDVSHIRYLWRLADAVTLPHVVVKGALNLWRVPDTVIRKLKGDLP